MTRRGTLGILVFKPISSEDQGFCMVNNQLPLFSDPLVAEYLRLTREEIPRLAVTFRKGFPVSADHCFQRIVLDTISGGVWYEHIKKPTYKNMTPALTQAAINLCYAIIADSADITALNAQSLAWRGKL